MAWIETRFLITYKKGNRRRKEHLNDEASAGAFRAKHGGRIDKLYRVGHRNDERRRVYSVHSSYEEARRERTRIEATKDRGTYVDARRSRTTLSEYWKRFLEHSPNLRPATLAQYRSLIETHVLPALGDRPLDKIRREDVRGWIATMLKKGLEVSTTRSAHQVFRTVLSRAVADGYIAINPATGRGMIPAATRKDRRYLSHEELVQIVNAMPEPYRAFVLLLGLGGLRIGEAAALRVSDLDLKNGEVSIERAVSEVGGTLHEGRPKTPGSVRRVALPRVVIEALVEHVDREGIIGNRLLFTSRDGGQIRRTNFRSRVWLPALKVAGLAEPWPRVHDLRHTAAALAIQAGAHPKVLQAMLGHSSITVTLDRYGHLFPSTGRSVAEALDAGFRAVVPQVVPENGPTRIERRPDTAS